MTAGDDPSAQQATLGGEVQSTLDSGADIEDYESVGLADVEVSTPVCCVEGCETEVPGLHDGIEVSRRDGVACMDCWEFLERHAHLPDEEPRGDACVECILDAGAFQHVCEESAADSVLVFPGDVCPACGETPETPPEADADAA